MATPIKLNLSVLNHDDHSHQQAAEIEQRSLNDAVEHGLLSPRRFKGFSLKLHKKSPSPPSSGSSSPLSTSGTLVRTTQTADDIVITPPPHAESMSEVPTVKRPVHGSHRRSKSESHAKPKLPPKPTLVPPLATSPRNERSNCRSDPSALVSPRKNSISNHNMTESNHLSFLATKRNSDESITKKKKGSKKGSKKSSKKRSKESKSSSASNSKASSRCASAAGTPTGSKIGDMITLNGSGGSSSTSTSTESLDLTSSSETALESRCTTSSGSTPTRSKMGGLVHFVKTKGGSARMLQKYLRHPRDDAKARKSFDMYDFNKDGYLCNDEFKLFGTDLVELLIANVVHLAEFNPNKTPNEFIQKVWNKLDVQDGKVSFATWKRYILSVSSASDWGAFSRRLPT